MFFAGSRCSTECHTRRTSSQSVRRQNQEQCHSLGLTCYTSILACYAHDRVDGMGGVGGICWRSLQLCWCDATLSESHSLDAMLATTCCYADAWFPKSLQADSRGRRANKRGKTTIICRLLQPALPKQSSRHVRRSKNHRDNTRHVFLGVAK